MTRMVIFAGLPGVGKTTVAKRLAEEIGAVYLRADTIEQALRAEGMGDIGGAGYAVMYAVARENLRLGRRVVCDSVNPWELTREAYRACAREVGVGYLDVEVVCSDQEEHKRRVEGRVADIEGHALPDWEAVVTRDYQAWGVGEERMVVDTAGAGVEEIVGAIRRRLGAD